MILMAKKTQKRNGLKHEIEIHAIIFKNEKAEMDGGWAAARLGIVRQRADGRTLIDTNQLKELQRLKIPFELLTPLEKQPKNHRVELRRE